MSRILYFSVHEVLERDEVSLFTELGHDVFSFHGAYMHPEGHPSLKRPGIPGMTYHEDLAQEAMLYARTKVPQSFFDKFDAIVVMHDPNIVVENWDRMKHKKVIWRTIGQSTKDVENMVRKMRYEGMKIVRMSPKEENIVGYLGSDALIRFQKDPEDLKGWTGHEKRVINLTQSLKGRTLCHYDSIMQILNGFPALVYGSGNTDLGGLDGGEPNYDLLKGVLRDNRVFVYGGTWPSPYTLSVMEAMMTGIPIVAIGRQLAEEIVPFADRWAYYEMEDIIKNGENGFISNDINQLRGYVDQLLQDDQLADRISKEGRKTAIRLWDHNKIQTQWKEFFSQL